MVRPMTLAQYKAMKELKAVLLPLVDPWAFDPKLDRVALFREMARMRVLRVGQATSRHVGNFKDPTSQRR